MAGAPPRRPKYRIRFRKAGDLRLVSHHDLMNCFERMFRRAALPLASSHGFHPKPRIVFALSLALGVVGHNEVVEFELTEEWLEEALLHRLREHAPPGIAFHSVRRLEHKSSAQPRRAFYRRRLCSPPADLESRCQTLLQQPHLWVERMRPQPRRLDVRPFLSEIRVNESCLEMALWVTPHGTARPDEVAQLLGLDAILEDGAYFERTDLEMLDEAPDGELPVPPPTTSAFNVNGDRIMKPEPRTDRPTPLLSGPLAFDS